MWVLIVTSVSHARNSMSMTMYPYYTFSTDINNEISRVIRFIGSTGVKSEPDSENRVFYGYFWSEWNKISTVRFLLRCFIIALSFLVENR